MRPGIKAMLSVFLPVAVFATAGHFWLRSKIIIKPPHVDNTEITVSELKAEGDSVFYYGDNWLRRNRYGLWEMYVTGKPYERGYAIGQLSSSLIENQERAFVNQITEIIPSETYRKLLNFLLAIINRNLDQHIDIEYLEEIYAISQGASSEYDNIGPAYQRLMNYHAAHDIGHMLQDYRLVGCTSFGVWGGRSTDSNLTIGRNFDFYVGDEFAKEKIVAFIAPDSGYRFMMITWGGMAGVVSGMNEAGLTVTINAAKSFMPLNVATPVSLLARKILQYASNISEAMEIANSSKIFVSEAFLIGSAKDNRAAIIEKTPYTTALAQSKNTYIICTNHFQGMELTWDDMNQKEITETPTLSRWLRVKELIDSGSVFSVQEIVSLLRDRKGINGANLGNGNELAINQLIGHHSVVFKPAELKVWVSTSPWQLGPFVCYSLDSIFKAAANPHFPVDIRANEVEADTFILTQEYENFLTYRNTLKELVRISKNNICSQNCEKKVALLIEMNPDYYQSWAVAADYFLQCGNLLKATEYYNKALLLQIPRKAERDAILHSLTGLYYE